MRFSVKGVFFFASTLALPQKGATGDAIRYNEPYLPLAECSFARLAACPSSLDFRSCLRASCPALRDSG